MTKQDFNKIRSRLEMRKLKTGSFSPKNDIEDFVYQMICAKKEIEEKIKLYK